MLLLILCSKIKKRRRIGTDTESKSEPIVSTHNIKMEACDEESKQESQGKAEEMVVDTINQDPMEDDFAEFTEPE